MRVYLENAFLVIAIKLHGTLAYRRNANELKRKPMGYLFREFKQLCPNEDLVREIGTLVEDRNFCAHEAYLMTLEQQKDGKYWEEANARLNDMAVRADKTVRSLFQEMKHLHEPLQSN